MKKARATGAASEPGIRVRMAGLHSWAGLLAGWLLYAMFLTGSVSYFRDEISQWMRPELTATPDVARPAAVAARVVGTLSQIAPRSPQWSFTLPTVRTPVVEAFWLMPADKANQRRYGDAILDASTGARIQARDTLGGDFFYRFHFQFYYLPPLWGRWLAGVCAMFMLSAIVSGVITHKKIFADFFTFRWGKGQRAWLDAHNALSVFGLPFHVMITYTGLITLMSMYMPWAEQLAAGTRLQQQQLSAQLTDTIAPTTINARVAAQLAPVDSMVRQAEARWGAQNVGRVTITNPGDRTARVAVTRGEAARVSTSPQYMLFNGVSGEVLAIKDSVGAAAETRGVLYALHLGRFGELHLRWLYFLVSLGGTAMVGTGLVMWTVKRRQRLADPARPHRGFWWVERLNVASIAGLSVAMSAYFWGNRLLPVHLTGRSGDEIDVFFAVWAATLVYAVVRPLQRAWIELLWAATLLLGLLPLLNVFTTSRPIWLSVAQHDWVYVGFEAMALTFALLHAAVARRLSGRAATRPSRRLDAPGRDA